MRPAHSWLSHPIIPMQLRCQSLSLRSVRTAISIRRKARSLFSFALLVCFAVLCQTARSQVASPKEKPIKQYALIFYSTRTLIPEEQKQRPVDIANWVKQVMDMGIPLDPRKFWETEADLSAQGNVACSGKGSSDPVMITIVSSTQRTETRLSTSHGCIPVRATASLSSCAYGLRLGETLARK